MSRIPATTSSPSPSRNRRSRWITVLPAGLAAIMTAGPFFLPHGLVRITPVQAFSKESRQQGADVFKAKGCEHCHGVDGIGTERGPDLSGIGKRWKKDRIDQQVRNGGGGMPPFGDALQPDEMKQLVDYLSAKKKPSKLATPPVPAKAPSDDSGL